MKKRIVACEVEENLFFSLLRSCVSAGMHFYDPLSWLFLSFSSLFSFLILKFSSIPFSNEMRRSLDGIVLWSCVIFFYCFKLIYFCMNLPRCKGKMKNVVEKSVMINRIAEFRCFDTRKHKKLNAYVLTFLRNAENW